MDKTILFPYIFSLNIYHSKLEIVPNIRKEYHHVMSVILSFIAKLKRTTLVLMLCKPSNLRRCKDLIFTKRLIVAGLMVFTILIIENNYTKNCKKL